MNRRRFLRSAAAASATVAYSAAGRAKTPAESKIRVLCWSELTEPKDVYPDGISGAIARFLSRREGLDVRVASINDAEQGVSQAAVDWADVLIWWGHMKHDEVADSRVAEILGKLREGRLGLVAIHSALNAKVFMRALDCTGKIASWRHGAEPEFLKCVAPAHPVARGLGDFTIPETEMYDEPFEVPTPEKVVYFSYWEAGEQFRSCCVWTVGKGRLVYFRPGHETYRVFHQELPNRVVENSVRWCAEGARV
jgi:trehalose utilization protein